MIRDFENIAEILKDKAETQDELDSLNELERFFAKLQGNDRTTQEALEDYAMEIEGAVMLGEGEITEMGTGMNVFRANDDEQSTPLFSSARSLSGTVSDDAAREYAGLAERSFDAGLPRSIRLGAKSRALRILADYARQSGYTMGADWWHGTPAEFDAFVRGANGGTLRGLAGTADKVCITVSGEDLV